MDAKASSPKENVFISLVEAERRHIDKLLKACGQNVNEAARVLGLPEAPYTGRSKSWAFGAEPSGNS